MPSNTNAAAWTVTNSVSIIRNRWIDLRADDCLTPSGVAVAPYYVLNYRDWAHVVCTDNEGRVCVIWQYRHGVGKTIMELPGGVVDAGESPLDAAKRELLEETGIQARDWRACGNYDANPATHTNSIHIFACRVDVIATSRPDAAEDIRQEFLTLADLKGAIDAGHFSHLIHVGALARALNLI